MKRSLFLLLFLLVTGPAVWAQSTITLTFTGRDQNNTYVRLDNVTIQNLTRGWTEAIFFPDTVYTLSIGTGISDYVGENEMQVMPNPFDGKTQLNLCLAQGELVRMMIVDITGKKCAEYNGRLSEGDNIFEIMLTTPQTYILSVQTSSGMHSVKMVNTGRAGENRISLVGGEGNMTKVSIKSTTSHVFELGDEMRYTGYSQQSNGVIPSSQITQHQNNSETIVLHFAIETGPSHGQPCPGMPTMTDYDGNIYNTVQIGTQCWMKENLRTTHYANGDIIPVSSDDYGIIRPYRHAPDNNVMNVPTYGYLYNWIAVMHGDSSSTDNPSGVQGICPEGWHVPSEAEWTQLANYMNTQSTYLCGGYNNLIAKALASSFGWNYYSGESACAVCNDLSQNNASGFSALPTGTFNVGDGAFYFGDMAVFWTTTSYDGWAAKRGFCYDDEMLSEWPCDAEGEWEEAFAVRCVHGSGSSVLLPTVITSEVFNITTTTATCGGDIIFSGESPVTSRGVCWSTSHNPTIADNHTNDGGGFGVFTSNLTGLNDITTYYVRAYATNSYGISYGEEVVFVTTNSNDGQPCQGTPTVLDYDQNIYNTVQIGHQCWMKDNLRTTHYANGASIALGTSISSTTAYCYNPNNSSSTVNTYGYLYNWTAVMRGANSSNENPSGVQGICPNGWHVPSDAEWEQLSEYVGSRAQYQCDGNSEYIAKALASTVGWETSTTDCAVGNNSASNNSTGFSALPAGYCSGYGESLNYSNFGGSGCFWTTRAFSGGRIYRGLQSNNKYLGWNVDYSGSGSNAYSVRCIRSMYTGEPIVTTAAVTEVTASKAIAGGEVVSDGNTEITGVGLCWSTSHNPTIADSHSSVNVDFGVFTGTMTNLSDSTTYYYRAYISNNQGTYYGNELSFTTLPTPQDGQTCAVGVTDYDGNSYNTVQIGNQCWMKENMRTTHYADGTALQQMTSSSSTTGAGYYQPSNTYGLLYNHSSLRGVSSTNPSGVQSVCPEGWHVPSQAEWYQLIDYVSLRPEYRCGYTMSNVAKALASQSGWNTSSVACAVGNNQSINNTTGFNAMPSGSYGGGSNLSGAVFWSTTSIPVGENYYQKYPLFNLTYNSATPDIVEVLSYNSFYSCYAIRCVSDEVGEVDTTTTAEGSIIVSFNGSTWVAANMKAVDHSDQGYLAVTIEKTTGCSSDNSDIYLQGYIASSVGSWTYQSSNGDYLAYMDPSYIYTDANGDLGDAGSQYWGWNAKTSSSSENITYIDICNSRISGVFTEDIFDIVDYIAAGNTIPTNTHPLTVTMRNAYWTWTDASYSPNSIPTVEIVSINNVTSSSATVVGDVTFGGCSIVTSCGVCWNTIGNPTLQDSHTTLVASSGTFVNNLSNLLENMTYYVRVYATNSDGTGYSDEMQFTTLSSTLPDSTQMGDDFSCPGTPTVADFDENSYNTVKIGDQCWMRENLRTTHYADGTEIVLGVESYVVDTFPCRRAPNNDISNVAVYGYLYNWPAVMHGANSSSTNPSLVQGICPNGWHVPSNAEWTELTNYVKNQSQYVCSGNSLNIAMALAATTGWQYCPSTCAVGDDRNANNATRFSVVPSGSYFGDYTSFGYSANLWSTTQSNILNFGYCSSSVNRSYDDIYSCNSVRCLRNETTPTVTTSAATNVTQATATLNGIITNPYNVTIQEQGFEWKPVSAPDYSAVNATGTTMTYNLTGLTMNTAYTYRAYAITAVGTVYGEDVMFSTLAVANPDSIQLGGGQPCPGMPSVTDIDGNTYNTVQIGNQCWMKSNLRTTRYADGTTISMGTSTSTTTPYRYAPNNDTNSVAILGYLYNWTAAMQGANPSSTNPSLVRGACPVGWHLPSYAEWLQLRDYVADQSEYLCGDTVTNIAKALASPTGWNASTITCAVGNDQRSNNATGFSAIPVGFYYNTYGNIGSKTFFWSSTEYNTNNSSLVGLNFDSPNLGYYYGNKGNGMSLRCIHDMGETSYTVPTVTTGQVSNVTASTAVCGGSVISDGGTTVTARGVCWSVYQHPTVSNNHTTDGSGMGDFTSNITGLIAGVTYYVRAYATSSAGIAYGSEESFTTEGSSSIQTCPGAATVTDYDGNVYNTVLIGNQCWMRENLKTTRYADGTIIGMGTSTSTTIPYRYAPNNDTSNVSIYGYLYNWKAVMRNSSSSYSNPSGVLGVCPTGWHVPSDAEWIVLTNFVSSQSEYVCGSGNSNIAKSLASITGWDSSTSDCAVGNNPLSNNVTGFSALPAGLYSGSYSPLGRVADFWSATGSGNIAYERYINYNNATVNDFDDSKYYALSVRCVRD